MNAARYTKPNLSFPICDTEATHGNNLVWTADSPGPCLEVIPVPVWVKVKFRVKVAPGVSLCGQSSPFLWRRDFPEGRDECSKRRNPATGTPDCFSSSSHWAWSHLHLSLERSHGSPLCPLRLLRLLLGGWGELWETTALPLITGGISVLYQGTPWLNSIDTWWWNKEPWREVAGLFVPN